MWRTLSVLFALLGLAVVGCGGDAVDTETRIPPGPGADSPVGAVEGLIGAINGGDFTQASRLAVPGHAALAALAEGATFGEVAEALQEGDEEVAANFWAGFAQASDTFLSGKVTATEDGTLSSGDLEYYTITVQPAEGNPRTLLVREDDGYRVDLFASFASGLADKMITPTERLLTAQTEESRLILSELQEIVPSLMLAATLPGTTGEASQQILALIEVITRVS